MPSVLSFMHSLFLALLSTEFSAYYMGMARFAKDMDTLINDINQGFLQPFLINASPPGRTEVVFLKRAEDALDRKSVV